MSVSGRALATRLLFIVVGLGTAAWAPLVPFVKERAQLDEKALGILLLCLGAGSLVAMPVAGALAARFGFRIVLAGGTLIAALCLPALAIFADPLRLAGTLVLYGVGLGAVDCVMNLQAVAVEKAAGRPMMSGFHGFYSVGCILGSLAFAALLSLGLVPASVALVVAALILGAFAAAWPGILGREVAREGARPAGTRFAWPRPRVWILGLLCFIVFLTEGQALDWSAVFLRDHRGFDPAVAGLGFGAFSVAMTAARLVGDRIVGRLGPVLTMTASALVAALGLLVVTGIGHPAASLLGYGLVGAGCANVVPVLFTAAGSGRDAPAGVAIPIVTTIGYAGLLTGPAAIGFVAAATSLPVALAAVGLLLLVLAASSRILRDAAEARLPGPEGA